MDGLIDKSEFEKGIEWVIDKEIDKKLVEKINRKKS